MTPTASEDSKSTKSSLDLSSAKFVLKSVARPRSVTTATNSFANAALKTGSSLIKTVPAATKTFEFEAPAEWSKKLLTLSECNASSATKFSSFQRLTLTKFNVGK